MIERWEFERDLGLLCIQLPEEVLQSLYLYVGGMVDESCDTHVDWKDEAEYWEDMYDEKCGDIRRLKTEIETLRRPQ